MLTPEDLAVLKERLTAEEGRRSDVYDDATGKRIRKGTYVLGHPSVGIGHNLDATPLCDAAIDAQYEHDISTVINEMLAALPWTYRLDGTRFCVLVDIAFNAGIDGLLGFHRMLAALENKDYVTAAAEIEHSKIAPNRADRIAEIMRHA